MSKRITSIALFDKDSLGRLNENIKGLNEAFCKVPFREENRESLDTLPYHFTFTVWDSSQKDIAMEIIKKIKFNEIELKIIGVNVKESFNDSYNLYFEIERNNELYLKYKGLADKDDKVIFGGRLGQYKYYDMHKVIEEALKTVEAELNG